MTPLRRAGRRGGESPSAPARRGAPRPRRRPPLAAARRAASSRRRTSSWSPEASRPLDPGPDVRLAAVAVLLICLPLAVKGPTGCSGAFCAEPCTPGGNPYSGSLLGRGRDYEVGTVSNAAGRGGAVARRSPRSRPTIALAASSTPTPAKVRATRAPASEATAPPTRKPTP